MFPSRVPEMDPIFLRRVDDGSDFHYVSQKASGLWYRVTPNTAREVFYIQSLPRGIRLLVPADGDGLLVRSDSIPV